MPGNITIRVLAVSVCALIIACGCAQKSAQETTANGSQASPSAQTSNHSVRAYVDPKTGQLRDPTPEELTAEAAADAQKKQAAAANLGSEQPQRRETITPGGAHEIILDPSEQHPLRACVAKDGDIKMDHECEADTPNAKSGAKK